jgi:hypothetical protein
MYPGEDALSALSVTTSVPVRFPAAVGVKLIGKRQDAPAANVPAVEEPALTSGHEDASLLFRVKFTEMIGLFPVTGAGRLSGALPIFSTVIVCGLSVLVEPTGVVTKLRLGGSA